MKQLFLVGISLCVHLYFFLAFGSLFRKILGRKKGCSWYSPLFTPVPGLFLYYGFFEILALPMTLLLVPLHVLTVVWGAALAAVGLAAVFLCGRDWVKSARNLLKVFRCQKIICILGTMLAALLLMACNGMSFSGSRLGNGSHVFPLSFTHRCVKVLRCASSLGTHSWSARVRP